jgi:hypothetical protein
LTARTELVASHQRFAHIRRKACLGCSKVKSRARLSLRPQRDSSDSELAIDLSKADGPRDRDCEAVAALNVKVMCELAPLARDLPSYESFQQEAVALAFSIHDELFRSFALKQVKAFFRRAAAQLWREPTLDRSKTPFITSGQGLRKPAEPTSVTPLF